jgi:hypothetical protein
MDLEGVIMVCVIGSVDYTGAKGPLKAQSGSRDS